MFREKDILQLKNRGIKIETAEQQLKTLIKGLSHATLTKAATPGNGILVVGDQECRKYVSIYESQKETLDVLKFVPASGAATRMFKVLHEVDEICRQPDFNPKVLQKDAYKAFNETIDRLEDFAFYTDLEEAMGKKGHSLMKSIKNKEYHIILEYILGREGINYGNLPKGLIKFHKYSEGGRTAFEEHLVEGADYGVAGNDKVKIHLTVSPEHLDLFREKLAGVIELYEKKLGVRYEITFSIQKPSTDTIALNDRNEPFRENDGSLHFRPGGHGALLENLNETGADLVFIKNVDNVQPDRTKGEISMYKKLLAGILIECREQASAYISRIDKGEQVNLAEEIQSFLKKWLGTSLNLKKLQAREDVMKYFRQKLDRPLRVCGMVRNSGEPGGGPYWVAQSDHSVSLQIIEFSQVNHKDPEQEAIFNSATHFNPVDLVCGLKNHEGKKFDLLKYRDPNMFFLSKKFRQGRALKAYELPGLWNGSMADWNTVFVEVPQVTFSPVKTLNDLLRPEHQQAIV
jgi:hypothetical protein